MLFTETYPSHRPQLDKVLVLSLSWVAHGYRTWPPAFVKVILPSVPPHTHKISSITENMLAINNFNIVFFVGHKYFYSTWGYSIRLGSTILFFLLHHFLDGALKIQIPH